MQLKSIKEVADLKDKKVILRVDFNAPLKKIKEKGKSRIIVTEATKIKEALPTINFLVGKKAKVILLSHLGRPEGRVVESLRLLPVARKLVELLSSKVRESLKPYQGIRISPATSFTYASELVGKKVENLVNRMKGGDIILLENTRFYPGEIKSDPGFIKEIASLADLYVNNAFAASHREEGTIVQITKYLPSYAGFLLEKEVTALSRLLEKPAKPYLALIGGIKISTKIALIQNLLAKVNNLCLGGGIATTFFKAQGYEVGNSIFDAGELALARKLLKLGQGKLILPQDVIVGDPKGKNYRPVLIENRPKVICRKPEGIYDIGPETIRHYARLIKESKTVVWNGPFGYFEVSSYRHGSVALGRALAAHSRGPAFGVVGGGETIACLEETGMAEYVDHVSTGGGAMLTFLEGRGLPGTKPLEER